MWFVFKKFVFVLLFHVISQLSLSAAWTDGQVRAELANPGSRAGIDRVRAENGGARFPLSLAMAKWASQKARLPTSTAADQRHYAAVAREILNEARGFCWQNRSPRSQESACMASTSIDVALATNDTIDTLWDGLPRVAKKARASHYKVLKDAAIAARNIGSKAPQLRDEGIINWVRMPGVRNFLIEPLEAVKPENIRRFFTPSAALVTIAIAGTDWRITGAPDTWEITEDARERLLIADGVIRRQNAGWAVRAGGAATLAHVRNAYNELKRLGAAVAADLLAPSEIPLGSAAPLAGYGVDLSRLTKLIPLFSLLDPKNFLADEGFDIGNIRIESATAQWLTKSSSPDFRDDFASTSALLDLMEPIIKAGGFGGQGVHALDRFQIANTKKILAMARKYFGGHYTARGTKAALIAAIDARLTTLGASLTAYYDGGNLAKVQIMTHLRYVLGGYPGVFRGPIESESGRDGVTEAEWVEILSMIFDFSQKLDTFRLNTGIDMTPYNLESTFYSQLWENQYTGGGCVPGRKNRILYRLANLLRQWMGFGYQLA